MTKYTVKEKVIIDGLYCLKFNVDTYGVSRNLLKEILSYRCYDSGYDEITAGFLPDNIKYLTYRNSIYTAAINGHFDLTYKIRDMCYEDLSGINRESINYLIYGAFAQGGHLKYVKQIYDTYHGSNFYLAKEKYILIQLLLNYAVRGNSMETLQYCYERLLDIHRMSCNHCQNISLDIPCLLYTPSVTAIPVTHINDENGSIEVRICGTLFNIATTAGYNYQIDNLDFILTKLKELGKSHMITIIKQKIIQRLYIYTHSQKNSIKLQKMLDFIKDYQI